MVRIKTRARTYNDRFPNGSPQIPLPTRGTFTPNNRIFTDHNGKQALMLEDEEGCGAGSHFRYEFFFLPGATAEECHAHYIAEIKPRGTIWDSILRVTTAVERKEQGNSIIEGGAQEIQDSSSNQDTTGNGQLPGLVVPEFHDLFLYRNWLFIYADANPDCSGPEGQNREMYLVEFDPIPQDMEEGDTFDPMDHPVYSKRVKARGEDGSEGGITGWMDLRKSS
ncbi:uncharacterized protein FTOL_07564 [Fusarium torulosum]|uniref:Uncharacterized protein n=1 Tax=Fusarium torulosum TaxID=33205 RepID=A0AAE8MC02_9HYPO|nr:uncharacterized protein FTOL_07564 [Fusarium torulosum]